LLYRSQDLRHWDYLHKLAAGIPNGKQAANPCDSGEMWECPDFFEINKKHCLLYSTENKVIWTTGEYDAQKHIYTPTRSGVLDHGPYYAPKSFLAPDQRRILWGWIRETRPEAEFASAGWAGAMSLPRVLTVGEQGQLESRPVAEMAKLRGVAEKATVQAKTPFRRYRRARSMRRSRSSAPRRRRRSGRCCTRDRPAPRRGRKRSGCTPDRPRRDWLFRASRLRQKR